MVNILVKKLENGTDLPIPKRQTPYSSGFDLYAAIKDDILIKPGERALIPCGFSLLIPEGYEAQIRPRSGLAYRHGVTVLNTPGTIDADYRGEICILLINLGNEDFLVTRGMRAAQMIIAQVPMSTKLSIVETLPDTSRSAGGFGSTGK